MALSTVNSINNSPDNETGKQSISQEAVEKSRFIIPQDLSNYSFSRNTAGYGVNAMASISSTAMESALIQQGVSPGETLEHMQLVKHHSIEHPGKFAPQEEDTKEEIEEQFPQIEAQAIAQGLQEPLQNANAIPEPQAVSIPDSQAISLGERQAIQTGLEIPIAEKIPLELQNETPIAQALSEIDPFQDLSAHRVESAYFGRLRDVELELSRLRNQYSLSA